MSAGDHDAAFWVENLQLAPHPEGGYYRQTYASAVVLAQSALPAGFEGPRSASTAIYFLLEAGNFSAFHRIRSDELWHFYSGDSVEVLVLDEGGNLDTIRLGPRAENGQVFQAVVPAGRWFASRVAAGGALALVGCTVSPGFHFDDFEMAKRDELTARYPQHRSLITELTRS